jgi:DNA recombination-dependent growth factor C
MDDTPTPAIAPAEWLEVLAESDADIAAGRIVPSEVVQQMFRDSIARLEAKQAAASPRKATLRH